MKPRRSLIGGESDPAVAAKVDEELRREDVFYVLRRVRELARGDEELRRILVAELKEAGRKRRGAEKPTRAKRAMLESNFHIARLQLGWRPDDPESEVSDYAAAKYLCEKTKLYPGTDPETSTDPEALLKRYKRTKRKK